MRPVDSIVVLSCLAPAVAAQQDPTWRYYRPGNTGIPGDYVQAILVDNQDRATIGAYIPIWREGGFSRYDGTTDLWTCFSNVDLAAIRSERVNDIEEGAEGILWIATDAGLLRFDPAVGAASLQRFDETNTPLPVPQVRDVTIDPEGNLWLAMDRPSGGGCLARFRVSANQWDIWTTANGLPWGGSLPGWNNVVRVAAAADPTGGFTVFFFGAGTGLGTWKDGNWTWNSVGSFPPPTGVSLTSLPFRPIDNVGNIWFRVSYPSGATLRQGFGRRDPTGAWTVIPVPPNEGREVQGMHALRNGRFVVGTSGGTVHVWDGSWTPLGLWNDINHTYCFGEESSGAIWVGGIGGSARWDGSVWQRHRISSDSMMGYHLWDIDFATDGRVFMNGNAAPGVGGFNIFDGQHWTCVDDFNYGLGPAWGLPTDETRALRLRPNGNLVLAPSGQGLVEWNGTTYTPFDIEEGDDVTNLDIDGSGVVWASSDRTGLYRFTSVSAPRQRFDFTNSPIFAGFGGIKDITRDPTSPTHVWLAQTNAAMRTNGTTWQVITGTSLGLSDASLEGTILCATPASDGTVWIGSMSGLFHVDPSTGAFTHFTTTNSALPSNEVRHIHFAPDGSMWIASWDSFAPLDAGGITHVYNGQWTTDSYGSSRMPHNQINVLNSRPIDGGYELWVGLASPGAVVLTFLDPPCRADLDDGSGTGTPDAGVTIDDLLYFLDRFGVGDFAADLDDGSGTGSPDGGVTIDDLLFFLDHFNAGC
ncbi:MAG: GC-type dockerin domain-anchored protein [Phycisphaerales bacterium]